MTTVLSKCPSHGSGQCVSMCPMMWCGGRWPVLTMDTDQCKWPPSDHPPTNHGPHWQGETVSSQPIRDQHSHGQSVSWPILKAGNLGNFSQQLSLLHRAQQHISMFIVGLVTISPSHCNRMQMCFSPLVTRLIMIKLNILMVITLGELQPPLTFLHGYCIN